MSDRLVVGIDWSEPQVRVVYIQNGVVRPLQPNLTPSAASILFDGSRNVGGLGVSFPSPLRMLGHPAPLRLIDDTKVTIEQLIIGVLGQARRDVERLAGEEPTRVTLAIPGPTTERRRLKLIECMHEAGFEKAELADACTAASAALRGAPDTSQTLLVYRVGYSETEVALVRNSRGRISVVATQQTEELSGEILDAMVIRSAVKALQGNQIFLGLREFQAEHWLALQHTMATARSALRRRESVDVMLPPEASGLKRPVSIRLSRHGLAGAVNDLVGDTMDEVHAVLERADLELGDLDAVYVVGTNGVGRPISDVIARQLDTMPRVTHLGIAATGAAILAADDAGMAVDLDSLEQMDGGPVAADERMLVDPKDSPPFVTLDGVPDRAEADAGEAAESEPRAPLTPTVSGETTLGAVRALLDAGRHEEAEQMLDELQQEIEALRDQASAKGVSGSMALIEHARRLVAQGQYIAAVNASHRAYDDALDGPDEVEVFLAMMDIHCEAGLGLSKPSDYKGAITQLKCALRHDQTNKKIQDSLAQRHLIHAHDMCHLNNVEAALVALDEALRYQPRNEEALALRAELMSDEGVDA